VVDTRDRERRRQMARQGGQSTMLTGQATPPTGQAKTLLGM
jgi:general stress protein YciG